MTEAEVMDVRAAKLGGTTDDDGRAVEAVIEALREALARGDAIKRPGSGSFGVAERAAPQGRNPRTGEKIAIPAAKVVKFKAGAALKKAVGGAAQTAA